jgi:hypothetical protein
VFVICIGVFFSVSFWSLFLFVVYFRERLCCCFFHLILYSYVEKSHLLDNIDKTHSLGIGDDGSDHVVNLILLMHSVCLGSFNACGQPTFLCLFTVVV